MCELPVKGLCLVGTFVSSGSVSTCLLICFVSRLVAVIIDVCQAFRDGGAGTVWPGPENISSTKEL